MGQFLEENTGNDCGLENMTSEERLSDVGFCGPEKRSLRGCETDCRGKVEDRAGINYKRKTIWLPLQGEMKWA